MKIDYFFFSLLLCTAVFAQKLPRRNHFPLRLCLSLLTVFVMGTLLSNLMRPLGTLLSQRSAEKIPALAGSRVVIASVATINYCAWLLLFAAGVHACFHAGKQRALFVATSGYNLQNAIYFVIMIIKVRTDWLERDPYSDCLVIGIYLLICLMLGLLYRFAIHDAMPEKAPTYFSVLFLAGVVLMSIFLSLNVPSGREYTVNYIYGILLNVLLIFLQSFLFSLYEKRNQIEIFDNLLHMEKKQHELTRDTIEMINIKCHDIKHQVAALYTAAMSATGEKMRRESLTEIQDCISIYESVTHTGNEMVDIILMEKSLHCEKHGIQFSYIIDGAKLAFMNSLDVCCLFSNALDNAIECVSNEPEESRVIIVHVSARGNLLSIHFENVCTHPVSFVDGKPVTSKADHIFHGYGTRSIERIVEKYGGHITMEWTGKMFITDILFALDEKGKLEKL